MLLYRMRRHVEAGRISMMSWCLTNNEVVEDGHSKTSDVNTAVHKQPRFCGEGPVQGGTEREAGGALAPKQRAPDGHVVDATDVVNHKVAAAHAFHVLDRGRETVRETDK